MSSPIRPADWEHFSIIRKSLSLDGLHVAMVGRDRHQLLDYAATLAVTLAQEERWHIEKYDPQRLETLIVDLMLNRFDAALQTLSDHTRSPRSSHSPGCVLFIPDAQSIPRSAFLQLVSLAAGTRDQRLRLIALFAVNDPVCEDLIVSMGPNVARWDLDEDAAGEDEPQVFPSAPGRRARSGHLARPRRSPGRLVAAAAAAAVLAALPLMWPAVNEISPVFSVDVQSGHQDPRVPTLAGSLGPESLPITAVPKNRETNGEGSETESSAYSAAEVVAESEAVRP